MKPRNCENYRSVNTVNKRDLPAKKSNFLQKKHILF